MKTNKDQILQDIKNNIITYPELRKGETFNSSKMFLTLYDDKNIDLGYGKLFDSLKAGVEYFSTLDLKVGVYSIKLYSYDNWSVQLEFYDI